MSAVGDRWVTINWQPGNDGYSPVRNFTLQQRNDGGAWTDLEDLVPHDAVAYTIRGYVVRAQFLGLKNKISFFEMDLVIPTSRKNTIFFIIHI